MPVPVVLFRLVMAWMAMYAGSDPHEVMPCRCCCREHTYATCEARAWGGCRSGLTYGAS